MYNVYTGACNYEKKRICDVKDAYLSIKYFTTEHTL